MFGIHTQTDEELEHLMDVALFRRCEHVVQMIQREKRRRLAMRRVAA